MFGTIIEQKRRYRQYKARTEKLPANYHAAIDAVERYTQYFGPDKAESLLAMLEDLADLFEESAANGMSVRDVLGEDPVEFAETFLQNYPEGQWITRERDRLNQTIRRIEQEEAQR